MNYRQAVKNVKKWFPNAVLSNSATGTRPKYYVSDSGHALLKDIFSNTKAGAWIAVAQRMVSPPYEKEVRIKRYPLASKFFKMELKSGAVERRARYQVGQWLSKRKTEKSLPVD